MEAPLDWAEYRGWARDKLIDRLAELTQELAGLHQALAQVQVSERQSKHAGWYGSNAANVTARERDADAQALSQSCAVMETKGRMNAAELERGLVQFLLEPR